MPDKPPPLVLTNVDSPDDDPKKALLVDLKALADNHNLTLAYLGTAAGLDVGTDAGEVPVYDGDGGIAGLKLKAASGRDGMVRLASLEQVRNRELGDAVITLTGFRSAFPIYETFSWAYSKTGTVTKDRPRLYRENPNPKIVRWVAPATNLTKSGHKTYQANVRVTPSDRIGSPDYPSHQGGTTSFANLLTVAAGQPALSREVTITPGKSYTISLGRPPIVKKYGPRPVLRSYTSRRIVGYTDVRSHTYSRQEPVYSGTTTSYVYGTAPFLGWEVSGSHSRVAISFNK